MKTSLYILIDPDEGVRYVGITDVPSRRHREHLAQTHRSTAPWVATLAPAQPQMWVVATYTSRRLATHAEHQLIVALLQRGVSLLNAHP